MIFYIPSIEIINSLDLRFNAQNWKNVKTIYVAHNPKLKVFNILSMETVAMVCLKQKSDMHLIKLPK